MTPSPIGKVLSTFRKHRVRALLMGGQACILYGAAEFSRDVDVAIAADEKNLTRLRHALAELRAEPVFVPALSPEVLLQGHACHFRLKDPEARGIRIDVMSVMHGCDPFEELWKRRKDRPAVRHGLKGELHRVDKALRDEEEAFRSADRAYWQPLRTQLLMWRRALKQVKVEIRSGLNVPRDIEFNSG